MKNGSFTVVGWVAIVSSSKQQQLSKEIFMNYISYIDINGDEWRGEWVCGLFYAINWSNENDRPDVFDSIPKDWKLK